MSRSYSLDTVYHWKLGQPNFGTLLRVGHSLITNKVLGPAQHQRGPWCSRFWGYYASSWIAFFGCVLLWFIMVDSSILIIMFFKQTALTTKDAGGLYTFVPLFGWFKAHLLGPRAKWWHLWQTKPSITGTDNRTGLKPRKCCKVKYHDEAAANIFFIEFIPIQTRLLFLRHVLHVHTRGKKMG